MAPVQIIIILSIILVGTGMIIAFLINQRGQQRAQTLAVIQGGSYSIRGPGDNKKAQDQRRAEIARKLKEQTEEEAKKKKDGMSMNDRISQAGLKISVRQFWLFSLILGLVLAGLSKLAGMSPFVCLMVLITGFLGIPRMILKKMAARRQKKFLQEFADALEAMIRLLRAGMPVSEAIAMVSREFTGPVGEEMAKIYDTQKIGIPLDEACRIATKRMPLTEMQMFATGITIQAQTGASLSDVLGNLANVIRSRFKLQRKVKSLSSEAKSSAMIIGALPVLVSSGIYFINPDYIMILFTDTVGKFMVAGAVVWMGFGVLAMKLMINFRV
jgi:tight adherence protein B